MFPQVGYQHAATDAHEVVSMAIDAASSAKELEVLIVVLSQVRRQ